LLPQTLPTPLAAALDARGYTDLTQVQASVIAPEAEGRDLLVSARTGSGKTVAFGLGIAPTLLGDDGRLPAAGEPLALVIAPTRELALQVQSELAWLYAAAGGRIVATVGGMDPRRERRALEAGCHIVVGTPGRLRDHVERKALDISKLRAVVLDEADEMLDMGFKEDLTFLLDATPPERRTLLFSATLPKAIVALAQDYQTDAFRIAAAAGETGHADIAYVAMHIGPRDAERAIVNILREKDAEAAIIFMSTRESVKRLHALLGERGFAAVCLSGEMSQGERNHALQALRDGRARVCVATDVAARGIDLPHLSLVIHGDLPLNAEVMQHRSGRTGRAGRKGTSILLVPPARRRKAERLLADARIRAAWTTPPTAEAIRALDRERFLADPLLLEETTDDDRAMADALLARMQPRDIAAILARFHRARLPEPEEIDAPMVETFDDRPGRKRRDEQPQREPRREREARRPHDRENRDRDSRDRDNGERDSRDAFTGGAAAMFRLDVGRRDRADPKWLLPMLCRMGGVTRRDIGAIRIGDETTEFEVSARAAGDFARNAARNGSEDMVLTRADGSPVASATKPPRKERFQPPKPRAEATHKRDERHIDDRAPSGPKPQYDKPRFDGPRDGKKPYAKTRFDKPDHSKARPAHPAAYEDRPPAEAQAFRRTDGDARPTAPYRKAKSRFNPAASSPDRTNRFTGGGSEKLHARSGFQHRKGGKGKPKG
jgi:ATP-dependent RNA helicase DeaD